MPICDICATQIHDSEMKAITSSDMKEKTSKGFVPSHLPQSQFDLCRQMGLPIALFWKMTVENNSTDWGLCQKCFDEAK